jgi:hypothetical protein
MEKKKALSLSNEASDDPLSHGAEKRKIVLNLQASQDLAEGSFRRKLASHVDLSKLTVLKTASKFIISGDKTEIANIEKLGFIAKFIEKPPAFLSFHCLYLLSAHQPINDQLQSALRHSRD